MHNFYRDICKFGFLGVPIFFVISGYCIGIAENHSKDPRAFITRRLFRIIPPYWVSILLVIGCAVTEKLITGTNSVFIPKEANGILATIFLYTFPVTHLKTINWVYWTLPYELIFYFLIFFSMHLSKKMMLVTLIVLTLISIVIPIQNENILFFFNELPTFIAGYSLYYILRYTTITINYLETLLFIAAISGIFIKHTVSAYFIVSIFVCLFIFIDRFMPLRDNFFSRLGDYSYSLYLIHVPIGLYLLGFIKNIKIVQTNILLNITVDVSLLALLIFISKFTFQWVESKSIALGKKYAK